jgi:L,D-transpeptidase ErfK/SrfK
MGNNSFDKPNRRALIAGAVAVLGTAAAGPVFAQVQDGTTVFEPQKDVRNNVSSFRMLDWRPYFENTKGGAILADTQSKALHYWSEDQSVYKLYPTSVPLSPELTRTGRTEIIKKVVGPDWRPTAEMKLRNPDWPDYIPAGPDSPLGTHAMWLSWPAYRIHGTHDTRKIGRASSNGCIGLYNEHIAELFSLAVLGTQVLLV